MVRLACCFVMSLVFIGRATAADPDAKTIIAKAIEAAGGAKLRALPASIGKFKGVIHEADGDRTELQEVYTDTVARSRVVRTQTEKGVKIREIRVYVGTKGWTKTDDSTTEDMDKEALALARQEMYVGFLTCLWGLTDPVYQLTAVGKGTVADRPVWDVKVTRPDYPEVTLSFDQETWMLLKTARRFKNPESGKWELEEILFDGYHDVQGTKQPRTIKWTYDTKVYSEVTVLDLKLLDKLDDDLFAKP